MAVPPQTRARGDIQLNKLVLRRHGAWARDNTAFQGPGPSGPNNGKNNGNGAVVGAIVGGVEPVPSQPNPLVSPNSAPADETTTTSLLPETRTVSWTSLVEGDCTNDRLLDSTSISFVEVRDCEEPHRFEVFAVVSPWDDNELFPGDGEAQAVANTECDALFDDFYGAVRGTDSYDLVMLYPNSELSWTVSKDIFCVIGDVAQTTIEGSLRNAAE